MNFCDLDVVEKAKRLIRGEIASSRVAFRVRKREGSELHGEALLFKMRKHPADRRPQGPGGSDREVVELIAQRSGFHSVSLFTVEAHGSRRCGSCGGPLGRLQGTPGDPVPVSGG